MTTHSPSARAFGAPLFLATAAMLFGAQSASASGVHAGTVIRNVANATYDTGGGTHATIASNSVDLRVDEVLDVADTARDTSDAVATSGAANQARAFVITNAGNGPETFVLAATGVAGANGFTPSVTGIAIDTNGNGVYDAGIDQMIGADGHTPSLDADTTLTVFVLSSIPATATDGQRGDVRLTATALTGSGASGTVFAGQGSGGGDAIVGATHAQAVATSGFVVQQAALNLVKSATVADPYGGTRVIPGSLVTYKLTATVSGGGSIANLHLTDAIPAGTQYQPGTLTLDGTALTDAADADAGTATATGIDVAVGTQAAGITHAATFTVKIN